MKPSLAPESFSPAVRRKKKSLRENSVVLSVGRRYDVTADAARFLSCWALKHKGKISGQDRD